MVQIEQVAAVHEDSDISEKTSDQHNEEEKETTINQKDVSTLFEMIGELTERMKTITTTVALIPDMQTQLTSLQEKVDTQLSGINARVLVNEEDIKTSQLNFVYN